MRSSQNAIEVEKQAYRSTSGIVIQMNGKTDYRFVAPQHSEMRLMHKSFGKPHEVTYRSEPENVGIELNKALFQQASAGSGQDTAGMHPDAGLPSAPAGRKVIARAILRL